MEKKKSSGINPIFPCIFPLLNTGIFPLYFTVHLTNYDLLRYSTNLSPSQNKRYSPRLRIARSWV